MNNKELQQHGESESGIREIVETFTMPNDVIVDPFVGEGTVALVAKQLKRRFIGIVKDPNSVEITKARLQLNERKA
ncbi:MAG: DNA methyltransferase [Candidatus Bathyarchaeia archaeon]